MASLCWLDFKRNTRLARVILYLPRFCVLSEDCYSTVEIFRGIVIIVLEICITMTFIFIIVMHIYRRLYELYAIQIN